MIRIAETIVRSALVRRETRGAHTRVDYPEPSDELQDVNTVPRSVGGEIRVEFVKHSPLRDDLAEIIFERDPADHSVG